MVENISGICFISLLRMIFFNQVIKTPIKCPSASPHKPFLVKLLILLHSPCTSAPTKQIRCQVCGTQPTTPSLWGFVSTSPSTQSPDSFAAPPTNLHYPRQSWMFHIQLNSFPRCHPSCLYPALIFLNLLKSFILFLKDLF